MPFDDEKAKFIQDAIDKIIKHETKDIGFAEQIAVTIAIMNIMGMLSGLPLTTKIRIINILHDYLHTSEGLLKE